MSFVNSQGFNISGGQFTNVAGDQHYHQFVDPILTLSQAIKDVGANHNSETRHPPPKCHPDTRKGVLNEIYNWIHSESSDELVFWLYGPAGAGKSAIAQTIAETAQKQGYLVSSFFFSRSDANRNTANSLFLTVAFGLAISIPELREPIGQASLDEQYQKLIVEPCMTLGRLDGCSWLVIVDGLDECSGSRYASQEQQRILFIIAKAMATLTPYIRVHFLICSRPEPLIREAFDTNIFRQLLRRVALDNTFSPGHDIRIFLNTEFKRIRTSPRNHHIQFPILWPARGVVNELVQKARGQFIYAATVVKFVDSEYSNPCEQLEIVLHPDPHSDLELGSPFADLDMLYHQILSSNPQGSKLREILRALVVLKQEGLYESSWEFFVGSERDQYGFFACWLLRAINRHFQICGGNETMLLQDDIFRTAWRNWAFYCLRAKLNDNVLHELSSVTFTQILGTYIMDHLTTRNPMALYRIQEFLSQTCQLLLNLQVDSGTHPAVTQCYSDYVRGFCVRVLRPEELDMVELPEILDGTARRLACDLLCEDYMSSKKVWTSWCLEHLQVVSIGNSCVCTQAKEASSQLSLPCSQSTFGDVYHIQLSVALRDTICIAICRFCNLEEYSNHLSQRFMASQDMEYQALWTILDISGPCTDVLKLLPPFLPKIKYKNDQNHILRWVQSFPSEDASHTSPLIQQIQQIHCKD
ncbi:nwd2 [Moniliophthora roreri]|nr:nwd2 [Moniliophthora roreri]